MYFDTVNHLWTKYLEQDIDKTIHPNDDMFRKSKDLAEYLAVGHAGVSLISSVISLARMRTVNRVLDFGCGHGRVARHIRALLPKAELYFSDIDAEGAQFCAERFGGSRIASSEQFSELKLPQNLDLIWLGSVFTHLSYERMQALFDALFASLSPGGALIITFRGRNMYETMQRDHPMQVAKWAPLLRDYEATGTAYQPYEASTPDWGLSLNTPESMFALARKAPEARVLCFSEAAWAVAHDVMAWTRKAG